MISAETVREVISGSATVRRLGRPAEGTEWEAVNMASALKAVPCPLRGSAHP
jgi:hypothetical protein